MTYKTIIIGTIFKNINKVKSLQSLIIQIQQEFY